MAVFKTDRKKGFTVMSNSHLRDKRLSLKAKGLLSQMLSLPSDWDYSLSGLSSINRESVDAIRGAINELERAGYVKRQRRRDSSGKLTAVQYTIYEQPPEAPSESEDPITEDPHTKNPTSENPHTKNPTSENPHTKNPTSENPHTEKPTSENPTQQNKDIQNKDKINTDLQNTDSIPFYPRQPKEAKGKEPRSPRYPRSSFPIQHDLNLCREIIKKNIDYEILTSNAPDDKERIDEIVDLMTETICTARQTLRIAGDDYPSELVRSKYLKLNSEHLQFVLDCMKSNTAKIRNIKQYLKAVLFNAPSTMDNYYTSLVAHDMSSS